MPSATSSSDILTLPFVPAHEPESETATHAATPPSTGSGDFLSRVLMLLCPQPLALPMRDENAPVPIGDPAEDGATAVASVRHVLGLLRDELGFEHAAICQLCEDSEPLSVWIGDEPGETVMSSRRLPGGALRALLRQGAIARLRDLDAVGQIGGLLGLREAARAEVWACLLPPSLGRETGRFVLLLATEQRQARELSESSTLRATLQVLALLLPGLRLDEALRERTRPLRVDVLGSLVRSPGLGRYREFFESSTDGIIVLDDKRNVVWLNRVAEQLTGYATAGLAGRPLADYIPEAQRERIATILAEAHLGGTPSNFDLPLWSTSQETLTLSASTSQIVEPQRLCVVTFRDVTERRHLEAQLRRAKEFLDRVIDSTVDGIVVSNLRGKIRIFNQGASRITGYCPDEAIGRLRVWRLFPDREAVHIMDELRSSDFGGPGRLLQARRTIVGKGGERIPVALTAAMIRDGEREVATVGIFQDLRERLQMEESLRNTQQKLEQTQKQAVLVELAGTTAHELNQPLTSVMGYAGLLKQKLPTEYVELHRFADVLLKESERMADIVRKIGRITLYETQSYVGETRILDLNRSAAEPAPLPPEPPARPTSDGPLFSKLKRPSEL